MSFTIRLLMGVLHILGWGRGGLFASVILLNRTQESGRQVNHINLYILLGDCTKTKRGLAAANHLWQQSRCVVQELKRKKSSPDLSSKVWFLTTCISPDQLAKPMCLSKRKWKDLELTLPPALPWPRSQHGNFPDWRGDSSSSRRMPPVSWQDSVQPWL